MISKENFRTTMSILLQLQELRLNVKDCDIRNAIDDAYDIIYDALDTSWGFGEEEDSPIFIYLNCLLVQDDCIYFRGLPFSIKDGLVKSKLDGTEWNINQLDSLYDFLCYLDKIASTPSVCELLGVKVGERFKIGDTDVVYWIGADDRLYSEGPVAGAPALVDAVSNPTLVHRLGEDDEEE